MRTSSLLPCLMLAACGSVNNLSISSGPLTTVHAHVDLASIASRANGAPLLGAIVWGTLPNVAPICFEQKGDSVVDADCPDPFGFFPGFVDTLVQIDPNGTGDFDLPIIHLPPGGALIGADATDQIAYATVAVVADTNGDGRIELLQGEMDGGFSTRGIVTFADTPLAASFVTLQENQERLTFRQGSFAGLNLYYPAPSCATPPPGYSILKTTAYSDTAATCDFVGLDQTVEVPALSPTDATALACRTRPVSKRVSQPKENSLATQGIDGGLTPVGDGGVATPVFHCIGSGILLIETTGVCPIFSTFVLKGCTDDPQCMQPTWDETASPPSWWPCGP